MSNPKYNILYIEEISISIKYLKWEIHGRIVWEVNNSILRNLYRVVKIKIVVDFKVLTVFQIEGVYFSYCTIIP